MRLTLFYKILLTYIVLNSYLSRGQGFPSQNINVDPSTGIMNYGIPLFNFSYFNYPFNFLINYTAKGVKTTEDFSTNGTCWSLSDNAVSITRQVRGLCADEYPVIGFLSQDSINAYNIYSKKIDGESDIFTLSLRNSSVSFYIEKNNSGLIIPQFISPTNVKISCDYDTASGKIDSWHVTDDDGTIYILGISDKVLSERQFGSRYFTFYEVNKWSVKELKILNKSSLRFCYKNYIYYQYASNFKINSDPNGRPVLGNEDTDLKHEMSEFQGQLSGNNSIYNNIVSNISKTSSNIIELQNRAESYVDSYNDLLSSISQDSTLINQYNSMIQTYVSLYDNTQLLLNLQQNDLNYYNQQLEYINATSNNALDAIRSICAQMTTYTGTKKYNDLSRVRSKSLHLSQILDSIIVSPDVYVKFKYDTVHLNGGTINYLRLSKVIYISPKTKRFVYFKYKTITSNLLSKISIFGNDNRSIINEYSMSYISEDDNVSLSAGSSFIGLPAFNKDYWGYWTGEELRQDSSLSPIYPLWNEHYLDMSNNPLDSTFRTPYFALFPIYESFISFPDQEKQKYGLLHFDPFKSITIPSQRGNKVEADIIGQYSDENILFTFSRLPNPTTSKVLSLKSVQDIYGKKILFDYENNDVYIPDIDSTIWTGGIRIKQIDLYDNDNRKMGIKYKYRFPDENNSRLKSTGVYDEWGKWHTFESVLGGDDCLFEFLQYSGNLITQNSNNGTVYHYVEEIFDDSSTIGYKYLNILDKYRDVGYINATSNIKSLGNTLIAKIVYDNLGRVINVNKYGYAMPEMTFDGKRKTEVNRLNEYFPYIHLTSGTQLVKPQYKSGSITDYNEDDILHTADELSTNAPFFKINTDTFAFNYSNLYKTYYLSIANSIKNSFNNNYDYLLNNYFIYPYIASPRLTKIRNINLDYTFNSCDISNVNLNLPKTKPYLFEYILQTPIHKIITDEELEYTSIDRVYPSYVSKQLSNGNRLINKTRYVDDFVKDSSDLSIKKLIDLNLTSVPLESTILEKQKNNLDTSILSSQLTLYRPYDGMVDKTFSMKGKVNLASFTPLHINNNVLTYDSRYKVKEQFNKYDSLGNLLEYQGIDGMKYSMLYSYNSQLPVAKFINMSYDSLVNIIPVNKVKQLANLTSPNLTTIKSYIDIVGSLSKNLYTATSYFPNIGIWEHQSVNGSSIENEYDKLGRLTSTLDFKKNIVAIRQYPTHLSNEYSSEDLYLAPEDTIVDFKYRVNIYVVDYLGNFSDTNNYVIQFIDSLGNIIAQKNLYTGALQLAYDSTVGMDVPNYQHLYANTSKFKVRLISEHSYIYDPNTLGAMEIPSNATYYFLDDTIRIPYDTGYYIETSLLDLSSTNPYNSEEEAMSIFIYYL